MRLSVTLRLLLGTVPHGMVFPFLKSVMTMVTDEIIKKQFVHQTLKEGIMRIYSTQEEVARNNLHRRTGRLMTVLSAHQFESRSGNTCQTVFVRLLPYLRFLDMQYRTRNDRIAKFKRRNLALYNRVVWGVLYHETFPELRFGFTNEVRERIKKMLGNSLNPK